MRSRRRDERAVRRNPTDVVAAPPITSIWIDISDHAADCWRPSSIELPVDVYADTLITAMTEFAVRTYLHRSKCHWGSVSTRVPGSTSSGVAVHPGGGDTSSGSDKTVVAISFRRWRC